MAHHHESGDTKSFTLTIFLAFVVVFSVTMLFKQCHGPYGAKEHSTEQHHGGEKSHH